MEHNESLQLYIIDSLMKWQKKNFCAHSMALIKNKFNEMSDDIAGWYDSLAGVQLNIGHLLGYRRSLLNIKLLAIEILLLLYEEISLNLMQI